MSGLNKYIENAAEEKKNAPSFFGRERVRGVDRGGNSSRESANTNVFFSIM